ncbi:MAG: MipA/OmpV family protein [Burkholderiales bacterium]
MRDAKVFLLGAICAGIGVPAAAQQGLARAPALEANGWRQSSGPAIGLRAQAPRGESGWTGGVLIDSARSPGFGPARAGATDPGLRLRPDLGRAFPQPPQFGPPIDAASAVQAGAYVGYRFENRLLLSSAVRQGFGVPGLGSTKVDLGASYGFNVTPRHLITLSSSLTLGQPSGIAAYYGALGPDALSGADYRLGEPGAGFRLSWLYSFGRNLYLNTTLGYDRSVGDLDGPQGPDRNTTSFGTVFGYRW